MRLINTFTVFCLMLILLAMAYFMAVASRYDKPIPAKANIDSSLPQDRVF